MWLNFRESVIAAWQRVRVKCRKVSTPVRVTQLHSRLCVPVFQRWPVTLDSVPKCSQCIDQKRHSSRSSCRARVDSSVPGNFEWSANPLLPHVSRCVASQTFPACGSRETSARLRPGRRVWRCRWLGPSSKHLQPPHNTLRGRQTEFLNDAQWCTFNL